MSNQVYANAFTPLWLSAFGVNQIFTNKLPNAPQAYVNKGVIYELTDNLLYFNEHPIAFTDTPVVTDNLTLTQVLVNPGGPTTVWADTNGDLRFGDEVLTNEDPTYLWVAPNGRLAAEGTISDPFLDLSQALAAVAPPVTINLASVWPGAIQIPPGLTLLGGYRAEISGQIELNPQWLNPGPHIAKFAGVTFSGLVNLVYAGTDMPLIEFYDCIFAADLVVNGAGSVSFINCVFEAASTCTLVECDATFSSCILDGSISISSTDDTDMLVQLVDSVDGQGPVLINHSSPTAILRVWIVGHADFSSVSVASIGSPGGVQLVLDDVDISSVSYAPGTAILYTKGAELVGYVPAVPGDWVVQPTTVQEALDMLSAATAAGVSGPGASTDNAIVRWDGITGALIQDSPLTMADTTGDLSRTGDGILMTVGTVANQAFGVGLGALASGVGAGINTACGLRTLASLTTGVLNTAVGARAGEMMTGATSNTLVGARAGRLLSGNACTYMGADAGGSSTTTLQNVGVGSAALSLLSTGAGGNIGIGVSSGGSLASGSANTMIGHQSGLNYTGAESNNLLLASQGVVGDSATTRIGSAQTKVFCAGVRGITTGVADGLPVVIDSAGQLGTAPVGVVSGPVSSTDNAIVRWDGVTGKIVQDSVLTVADTTGVMTLTGSGVVFIPGSVTASSVGVGLTALANLAAGGDGNAALGFQALNNLTTGTLNTAVGFRAGRGILTSNNNTFLGYVAGTAVTGSNNTLIGASSGQFITTSPNNTVVGRLTVQSLVGGTGNNTIVGSSGGGGLVSGSGNLLLGNAVGSAYAGAESNNILLAHAGVAAESNTTRIGSAQTRAFIAGVRGITTGVADGLPVVIDSTGQLGTAPSTVVLGPASATDNALARFDTTTGQLIQNSVITCADTTGILAVTGSGVIMNPGTTAQVSVSLGVQALANIFVGGNGNTAIGNQSFAALTTGSSCTGLGFQSGLLNVTGTLNTFIGALSGSACVVSNNTLVGANSGVAITSSPNNTIVGRSSAPSLATGTGNNVMMGAQVGGTMTTGNSNVVIGTSAGSAYTGAESNNVIINNAGVVGESGVTRLGTTGVQTQAFCAGIYGVTSTDPAYQYACVDTNGKLTSMVSPQPVAEIYFENYGAPYLLTAGAATQMAPAVTLQTNGPFSSPAAGQLRYDGTKTWPMSTCNVILATIPTGLITTSTYEFTIRRNAVTLAAGTFRSARTAVVQSPTNISCMIPNLATNDIITVYLQNITDGVQTTTGKMIISVNCQ